MTVRLRYHGHCCLNVEGAGKTIWLDPLLTKNPLADIHVDDVEEADYVLISHGHGDQLGDSIAIACAERVQKGYGNRLRNLGTWRMPRPVENERRAKIARTSAPLLERRRKISSQLYYTIMPSEFQ